MLGPIEDVDVSGHSLGREEVGVLRHVPSSVDLSVVRDGLDCFDTGVGEGWGGEFCDGWVGRWGKRGRGREGR